jgi:pSer/pThr/pTyr-binding forkhead associated (FHA) protein
MSSVALKESSTPVEQNRRPARDLILAVLENMRRNLEPLRYTTIAPSRYLVYLHPIEYGRLEGLIPLLQEQTLRALAEELDALNKPSLVRKYTNRILGHRTVPVQSVAGEWHVEFLHDPDDDVAEGDILIVSELALPTGPELAAGERTRRIATVHSSRRTTTRQETVTDAHPPSSSRIFARIEYADNAGHHSFDAVKDSITIGRGGITYPVDIRIVSSVDVSREHARIRRDPKTGEFFLIDLSSLGTTLNGRHVPRGYDELDGTKRENGAETPLPDKARIGLADTVYLQFVLVR